MSESLIINLAEAGFVTLPKVFSSEWVAACRAELEEAALGHGRTPHVLRSTESVHVHNFFLHGARLRRTLFGPELQELHAEVFGTSYCLRNAVASSIQLNPTADATALHAPIGAGWHRDTPQFHDRAGQSHVAGPGVTFQVIVAIDNSSVENSTKVIPGSHTKDWPGHRLAPDDAAGKIATYGEQDVVLQAGDVAVIDDNLFHRAGLATPHSRWMLFCSYTPWFVKPYFNFSETVLPDLTAYEKHCLHMTAVPPRPEEPLRNTFRPTAWDGLA
jgi:hypothetical protein